MCTAMLMQKRLKADDGMRGLHARIFPNLFWILAGSSYSSRHNLELRRWLSPGLHASCHIHNCEASASAHIYGARGRIAEAPAKAEGRPRGPQHEREHAPQDLHGLIA